MVETQTDIVAVRQAPLASELGLRAGSSPPRRRSIVGAAVASAAVSLERFG